MTTALRNGRFRRLSAVYTSNLLIEWFSSVALMVVVYDATKSASLAAALLISKQVLPGLSVTKVTAFLDQWSIGRALTGLFIVQSAALAALAGLGYGPALFAVAFVTGTAGAAIRSILRAAVARSLRGPEFRAGNALLNVITGVASPIGPALAAYAVAASSAGTALFAAAAGMAALGLAAVTAGSGPSYEPVAETDPEADRDQSAAVAAPSVPLSWLLALVAMIVCAFTMDQPALLAYSEDALGAGVGGYGAIFAAWGIGNAIGSVVFTRLLHLSMLRVYVGATALSAFALIGMGLSPSIAVTCAIAVLGGVGNGIDWVAIVTLAQEATRRGDEARTAARLESIAMTAPVAGLILGGIVADLGSPRLAIGASGGLALGILIFGAIALRTRDAHPAARGPIFSPSIPGGSA